MPEDNAASAALFTLFHPKQREGGGRAIVWSLDDKSHPLQPEENTMRKIIISATVAIIAAVSFAAPSYAGHKNHHHHHGYHGNPFGGFSVGFYNSGYYGGGHYEPSCYVKKVKRWDKWGNLYFKKIKFCD
ncbi:hypothetical protein [Pararhizobium gei]|uniref:hypothetical protein n=1 Tax=Pararhizobium gei TaxID=1395951 RepID=UPI0023DBF44F|nr:hypothetical protein [Rhizobium gei]